jgi:hypothetical protein
MKGFCDVVCASLTTEAVTKFTMFISHGGKTTLLDIVHAGNEALVVGERRRQADSSQRRSAPDSSGRDAND